MAGEPAVVREVEVVNPDRFPHFNYRQMIDLSERKILVTGAGRARYDRDESSGYLLTGIGDEITTALLQFGLRKLVIQSVDKSLDPGRLDFLQRISDPEAVISYKPADFSRTSDARKLVKESWQQMGEFDTLILSAGVCNEPPAQHLSRAVRDRVMRINADSPFAAAQEFVTKVMAGKELGAIPKDKVFRIIGVSSINAHMGEGAHAAYDASKAAFEKYLIDLGNEDDVFNANIKVVLIAPGLHLTPLTVKGLTENRVTYVIQDALIPGGITPPTEVAKAVLAGVFGFLDETLGQPVILGGIAAMQPSALRVVRALEKMGIVLL